MIRNSIITLNKFTEIDREFYSQIYLDNTLMKYVTKPLEKAVVHHSFDLILKRIASKNLNLAMYVISLTNTGKKVGIISLRLIPDEFSVSEIGVIILSQHQRQGFAHQAKEMLIQETFKLSKTNTIIAICDKSNIAANRANKKLGFKLTKEFLDTQDNKLKIKWRMTKQDMI